MRTCGMQNFLPSSYFPSCPNTPFIRVGDIQKQLVVTVVTLSIAICVVFNVKVYMIFVLLACSRLRSFLHIPVHRFNFLVFSEPKAI